MNSASTSVGGKRERRKAGRRQAAALSRTSSFVVCRCRCLQLCRDDRFLSLLDGHELLSLGSGVDGGGSEEFVALSLFDDVRSPSCRARDHKDGREEVRRHAALVVGGGGEEIQIRKDLLLVHHVLNNNAQTEKEKRRQRAVATAKTTATMSEEP